MEFIHPAEVDICNKIAELGNCYRKICQFYDDYAFGKSYENKPLRCNLYSSLYSIQDLLFYFEILDGLYLEMFCDALNTVILKPYTIIISDLESKLLKEHYLNVTYLQGHLEHVSFTGKNTTHAFHDYLPNDSELFQTVLFIIRRSYSKVGKCCRIGYLRIVLRKVKCLGNSSKKRGTT